MRTTLLFFILIISQLSFGQIGWMSSFNNIKLPGNDTFWNGADSSGGFLSGKAFFKNNYNHSWGIWSGFALSNTTDTLTADFTNQYSAIAGHDANFTTNYAVISEEATVVLLQPEMVEGVLVTNGTYPYLSMKNGDGFAKKFGGATGDDPDYFRIVATGFHNNDSTKTTFYLADYRSKDNAGDYIVKDWQYMDLSSLGVVDSIRFSFESSDAGQFGINTPKFFCMDNFNGILYYDGGNIAHLNIQSDTFDNGKGWNGGFKSPSGFYFENNFDTTWNTWSGWANSSMSDTSDGSLENQYSSCVTSFHSRPQYLIAYSKSSILFPHWDDSGFSANLTVSNSTYAYKTMKYGNAFAKKFGGETGNDKDFLVLKISGIAKDGSPLDTIEHYLADFRFDDNSQDYISRQWEYISFHSLIYGRYVARMDFWLEGSDTGQFGLNTPAYFCMQDMFIQIEGIQNQNTINFNLYPNPAANKLYFDIDTKVDSYQILDISGKVLINTVNQNSINVIDISALKQGLYILQLNTDRGLATKRFVKE
ncbi:MAG: DUF4465 domain-containing protein [Bacteroidia bacterium]